MASHHSRDKPPAEVFTTPPRGQLNTGRSNDRGNGLYSPCAHHRDAGVREHISELIELEQHLLTGTYLQWAGMDNQTTQMTIHEFGGPELFTVTTVPTPSPGPGEVLVRITAIGVNPLDYKMRDGSSGMSKNLTFPCVLGREAAGEVISVGERVENFAPGDRVFGARGHSDLRGTYADHAVFPAEVLAHTPDKLEDRQVAGLSIVGRTALASVDTLAKVSAGDTVLIHGAGGGVGQLMTQLSVARGATVYASASTRHAEKLAKWGATHIDYTASDVSAAVWEQAGKVDVVLDGVYFDTFLPSLDLLKEDGRIVVLPSLADLGPAEERGIEAHTPVISPDPQALEELAGMLADGALDLIIGEVLPLSRIADAHRLLENGHANGKVIVEP